MLFRSPTEEVTLKFKGIDSPRGEADDLKRISGITNKIEQRLNDAGVFHFWQIADLDPDSSKALDLQLKLKGLIDSEKWIEQAKKFEPFIVASKVIIGTMMFHFLMCFLYSLFVHFRG